jgi:hypothetical protein
MRRFRRPVFYVFVFDKKSKTRQQIINRFRNGGVGIPGISRYEIRIRSQKSLKDLKREVEAAVHFYILVDAAMPEDEKRDLHDALCDVCENETVSLKAVNLIRKESALCAS